MALVWPTRGRRGLRSRCARRALRYGRSGVPGLAGGDPRAGATRAVVGADRGDHGRDLWQRPPPFLPQHRPLADPGLSGCVPIRARTRDGRPGRGGRTQLRGGGGGAGRHRSVHPLPTAWDTAAVCQLRAGLDVVVPEPRQPGRELGPVARIHAGPRRRVGRPGGGARLHAPPATRRPPRPRRHLVRARVDRVPRHPAGSAA